MSRAIDKEWIATNDDQNIPPRVKIRIFDRANGKCQSCSQSIVGGRRPSFDHIQALVNGGQHAESNLQLLCMPCHSLKTASDVAEKSATARVRAKHIGLKKLRTIRSWRRFDGTIVYATRNRT